jgi:AraC family transcriptional regulator
MELQGNFVYIRLMSGSGTIKRGAQLELGYLHGGEVVYQPGDSLGPRELNDFELVYIIEGTVTYETDGESYTVEPGGFILGRPGTSETYRWDVEKCTRHAFFHFDIESMPSDWPDPAAWPRARNKAAPLCVRLLRHISQHLFEHGAGFNARPLAVDCRLMAVLLDALIEDPHAETGSFERDRPEPVRRALMHIRRITEEDPHYPLSLAELASEAHVTEKHLCRLFVKWVGHSPMQTYTLLRLESAMLLLARTNLSVQEVALRSGFKNALYFSRLFSKAYGLSPRAFRGELKAGSTRLRMLLPVDLVPRIRW